MDADRAGGPDTVPRALGRLRVALDDAYARTSRELGLSAQQAELVCAAMRPTPVGDLALLLRCDRSNVSRLVDRAAAQGLVERRVGERDARVSMVALTRRGDRIARQFLAALQAQLGDLLEDWSGQRQRSAVRLLNDIADALDSPEPTGLRR